MKAFVNSLMTVTPTVPATPTVPPPAAALTETTEVRAFARISMLLRALTTAFPAMEASVCSSTTRTATEAPTPAEPPMAMDAAIPRVRKLLTADTSTDWLPLAEPLLAAHGTSPSAQLILAPAPIVAVVWTVTTAIEPERLTAAVPAPPAAMPIEPR